MKTSKNFIKDGMVKILPWSPDFDLGSGTLKFQVINWNSPISCILSKITFNDLDCAFAAAKKLKLKKFSIIRLDKNTKFGVKDLNLV